MGDMPVAIIIQDQAERLLLTPQYIGPMPDIDPELDQRCLDNQRTSAQERRVYGVAEENIQEEVISYSTALHCGNIRRVIECINAGEDPHFGSELPLHVTASKGHLAFLRFLHIAHGANLDSTDGYALRWASLYGHRDVVKYLTDNGARKGLDVAISWAEHRGNDGIVADLEAIKQREGI